MRIKYDTKNYKRVVLQETEQFKMVYVQNKQNPQMDKIRFIKLGNTYTDSQVICIYRYEDEETINNMLSLYGYKEGE